MMNNKHQEALEKMFYYNMMPNDITEEELKQCDKTLQELVDIYPEYLELKARATPKKPIVEISNNVRHVDCPTCDDGYAHNYYGDNDLNNNNYCSNCGQALDWSKK